MHTAVGPYELPECTLRPCFTNLCAWVAARSLTHLHQQPEVRQYGALPRGVTARHQAAQAAAAAGQGQQVLQATASHVNQ